MHKQTHEREPCLHMCIFVDTSHSVPFTSNRYPKLQTQLAALREGTWKGPKTQVPASKDETNNFRDLHNKKHSSKRKETQAPRPDGPYSSKVPSTHRLQGTDNMAQGSSTLLQQANTSKKDLAVWKTRALSSVLCICRELLIVAYFG